MQKKKILIVDDDENARRVITQMLKGDEYSLDQADSGKDALKKVTAGDYDLLILDYMMPEMDGMEVMLEVKKLKPAVKVVMITAVYLTIEKAVEAMRRGASDYVAKPFEMKVFRETVKRVLATATAETLELGRLKEESPVAKFEERFHWIPKRSLVIFSGVKGTRKRLFIQQLAYAHMLRGDAVVYLTTDCSPKEVEKEISTMLPVKKFMDAGLLTLVSPHVFWEPDSQAPSYRFLNLKEYTRKIFNELEKSLKGSREAMLIVDSFSTQCGMLESNERVQLLHLLRSLTRRRPVTVLGIVHEEQVHGKLTKSTVPEVTRHLADAALDFEVDTKRNVVSYTAGKFSGWSEAPKKGELELRGGLLNPV